MMGRQVEQAALFYEFSLERHGARLKREYLRLLAEAGTPTSSRVVGEAS